ncbi:N-acetylmuramoyl-L-alanine amidase [Lysobacter sp. S4-A87]|uniref:N-acetylmuramoyl-L-alanine amidase n=1 Tax=Lysobacter sp. S4-A87 TaxID=2925843 RepID=UPI001F5381F3|nr:N-acetylmuramoyl-L-alanine amidase [Lysobacter sp. S4-A87]UNK50238.1 N-acetylmuramoyl-L-alanine amidase [Lysobacter sp. S4-A87]
MRVKAATVQKFLLGLALLTALAWNLAHASEIKGLELSAGATGTRAEIALDGAGEFKVISLKDPDRLVVDLPASSLSGNFRLPASAGVIKSVRTGQPAAGTSRIVFDLSQPVTVLKPRIEQGASGPRLVLEWPGDGAEPIEGVATVAEPAAPALQPASSTAVATSLPGSGPTTASASASNAASNGPAASAAGQPASPGEVSAASSEATTRLISAIVAGRNGAAPAVSTAPVPTNSVATNAGNAGPGPAPVPVATAPSNLPTTVATGVPTRIATGQPTLMPGAAVAGTATTPPAPVASTVAPAPGQAPVKTMKDVMRGRGMRPLVIAIDAGHGGQDPGALGPSGKREKDVTLAIARELARQVNATPGLKAHLVRDTDVFIPLPRRAQLARQAKADMFISIHADAAENRSAKGSSVYVLSLKGASSQRARWLADKENSSDLIGGVRLEQTSNTLASVLLDLTQSGHMKASEDAAGHVLDGLKRVGSNHKPHIERANFAVLRTSDMPAMLVETAFISNPDEERRLTDPAHQRNLARAVLDGVNTYFTRQPPPGTLYAARADASYVTADVGAGGGSP